MMEEDLEERLLGGHAVSAVAGDDSRGLHRYNTEQRNGFSSPAAGPQLRDLRKRKPSPDSGNRRRTTSSGSGDEAMVQSPRGSEATSPAPNPFDDDTPPSIEQPAAQHSHSNGVQDSNASRRVESPAARSINEPRTKEEQKAEKKKKEDKVEQVAPEIAAEDANVEVEEGKQERADSRKHDEDALARVHLRMERLWKLEEDHARLNYRYARLEEAKKKTEAERNEWQTKHARQVEENEKMAATLKEWEDKCAVLQREKQESEVAAQKLNKKLDDERERYALLSSQFSELNAKMVEIINNVTNLKIDEIEQEKEARRLGAPIKKRPPPPAPAPPITQSAAAYFGFGASPSKAKAAPLTPSKKSPRE